MAQFDFKQYQGALLAFLTYLDALQEPKSLIAEYLRFPEHDHSTLSSSKLGADMWREPTAKALVDELLKDKDLSEWFAPKSGPTPGLRLNELHSHIASLVAAWHEAPGAPEEIVRSWSDALLQDLKNPDPACNRIRILYGVSLAGRVELSSGTVIEPASVEGLRRFLQGTGGTERDVLRLPKRPAIFVSTGTKAKRNEYGAFAATTANAWSDVLAENARWDIWLATGVLPRLGDAYVSELSRFPTAPNERWPASQRETHSQAADNESALLEPERILKIAKLMEAIRGGEPSVPQESIAPLWVTNTFIHPAIDTPDALMTLLLAYAGCEGFLLREDDDRTRFGPRLAALVGEDVQERRRIQKIAVRWAEIRGSAAHGQRPSVEAVGAYLERPVSDEEASGLWFHTAELTQSARSRAGQLLRRMFLAALFCCVNVEADGGLRIGLSREDLIRLLEDANEGSVSAQKSIDDRVPDFVKEASF